MVGSMGRWQATGQQERSVWVTDTLNLFPEKWLGTSSSKGQPPGLWTQSPRGQTWQSQHTTLLGSIEVLPHTGHPPELGF